MKVMNEDTTERLELKIAFLERASAELSDDDRDYAVSVTWTFGLWVCAVNAVLLVGWWRDSRATLWVALIGGGLPLLWAWTLAIQAITDAATAPQ